MAAVKRILPRRHRRRFDRSTAKTLRAGSPAHYTAYVGPPDEYDLMGAMQFRLLATLGLRSSHTVLDFGCGSLRLGRLLIAYLEPGRYVGLEPNKWLVDEGIDQELGRSVLRVKQPRFFDNDDFDATKCGGPFDFVIAQSIFSHTGMDLMEKAISTSGRSLTPTGVMLFTTVPPDDQRPPFQGNGWRYPGLTPHAAPDVAALIARLGLAGREIPWYHLRQRWWIVSNDPAQIPDPRYDPHLLGGTLRVPKYAASVGDAPPPIEADDEFEHE